MTADNGNGYILNFSVWQNTWEKQDKIPRNCLYYTIYDRDCEKAEKYTAECTMSAVWTNSRSLDQRVKVTICA